MKNSAVLEAVLAFTAAVVFATVWGAIVQTQFNLAALNGIGADIGLLLNIRTTLADIFSGFSLTYAGYFVLPAFLVAFAAAWWVSQPAITRSGRAPSPGTDSSCLSDPPLPGLTWPGESNDHLAAYTRASTSPALAPKA